MNQYSEWMDMVGSALDFIGVMVIVIGAVVSTFLYLFGRKEADMPPFKRYRQGLGKAILLGLEFLVAGDIIRTVVVAPTLENITTLGLIVLIRTFLSMTLQLEVEGRWPWQPKPAPVPATAE
jgi:uncharacterized membrane protein